MTKKKNDYDSNKITIELYYPKTKLDFNTKILIENKLSHEILHGVKALNCMTKLSDEVSRALNIMQETNRGIKSPQVDFDISKIIYLLDDNEINAFLSELTGDVKKIISKHNWTTQTVNVNEILCELMDELTQG